MRQFLIFYRNSFLPAWNLFILIISRVTLVLSFLALFSIVYEYGFFQNKQQLTYLYGFYEFVIRFSFCSLLIRFADAFRHTLKFNYRFYDFLLLVFLFLMLAVRWLFKEETAISYSFLNFLNGIGWSHMALIMIFFRELFKSGISVRNSNVNPAWIFAGSFFAFILGGALLLLLPRATHDGNTLIAALFTSTSAICVNGLVVTDTAAHYTKFGQTIILLLMQLGGLGIMTFTSFFAFFFKGESSYRSQLLMQDMTSSERVAEALSIVKTIITVTFFFEGVGALLIYYAVEPSLFKTNSERVYFSVFHAVSAFCNAGFTTIEDGLYNAGLRFSYFFQFVIALLIVLGGLGFPIVFNFRQYILRFVRLKIISRFIQISFFELPPGRINVSSKLALLTSAVLLLFGTIAFLLFEYDNVLAEHPLHGKIVHAFFGAVTPRSGGLNSFHMPSLHYTTIMMTIFLMWVGASPGSTGGGIKTSTFAVSILNVLQLGRGAERIKAFGREISLLSVRRAYAVIFLSVIFIALSVFFCCKH